MSTGEALAFLAVVAALTALARSCSPKQGSIG
jgi:hypothetical protein